MAPDVSVDRDLLSRLMRDRPGPAEVLRLLSAPRSPEAGAAVVYLGLVGSVRNSAILSLCLQHDDPAVARLAEQCLWRIWMRAGSQEGNHRLADAIRQLQWGDYAAAEAILADLTAAEPAFAEAHFQRGLALASLDCHAAACECYREALRLNPYHFGATAALGHALVEVGRLEPAATQYRRALQMYPHLEDVRGALEEVTRATASDRKAD